MAAPPAQIRLTRAQRKQLDERRRRERRETLNATFGALPNLVVPSRGDWEAGPPQLTD
jgi:hypothetical protein